MRVADKQIMEVVAVVVVGNVVGIPNCELDLIEHTRQCYKLRKKTKTISKSCM